MPFFYFKMNNWKYVVDVIDYVKVMIILVINQFFTTEISQHILVVNLVIFYLINLEHIFSEGECLGC